MQPRRHEVTWTFVAETSEVADRCLLFTDSYGRLLQVVLAFTALAVLYVKRKLETPMRPLQVWVLDVGKQCVGAFLLHCLSIILSIVFVASAGNNDDECGIYFVTYMLDTTCGVLVLIVVLRAMQWLAESCRWRDLQESGFYGDPPRLAVFAKQLAAYSVAVLLMKMLTALVILAYYEPLAAFATRLFSSFTQHRHLELLLVMIIIPGCFNAFQFWLVDSYLKCDGSHWKYFSALDSEKTRAPIVAGGAPVLAGERPSIATTYDATAFALPAPEPKSQRVAPPPRPPSSASGRNGFVL
ncbi:hypothetical protein P43SY_001281 [Pythium insidiosum]|uniref:Transmembrane protein n=1 Tax=Pythium insidiosum TaxID=114742 RepID=A0AAD5Q794_PYTIN|nr:hypothetical protein P43SY_001281 [Pythium insidiosum]